MKNKKVMYAIIGMIALVLVTIGITYAYWLITRTQEGENVINTGCLDISLSNEVNDITLTNQFPMSDEDGKKLTPYEFTVTNNCNTSVDYQINLESLETGTEELNDNSIKMAINLKGETNIVGTKLSSKGTTDTTIENALNARKLLVGTLGASSDTSSDDEVTYELRLWLDANAPISEMNKAYKSKITITVAPTINVDVWDGTSATALADLEVNEATKTVNINSAADLAGIRDALDAGNLEGYNIELNSNIDLNNVAWEPIGEAGSNYKSYDEAASYFSGTFNGNGNTISNLNVVSDSGEATAFIEAVAGDTVIKNLNIENGTVSTSGKSSAALVAYAIDKTGENSNLTIENVNVNVNVTGGDVAGGIIGRSYNTGNMIINNCTNYGTITGPGTTDLSDVDGKIAGILGFAKGKGSDTEFSVTITNSINYGNIVNGHFAGGILSSAISSGVYNIDNCVNYGSIGKIDSEYSYYAGGILAHINSNIVTGEIKNSTNNGKITADYIAGGIIGGNSSPAYLLTNCINNGEIYGESRAGGIVGGTVGSGVQHSIITSCTNNGFVSGGTDAIVGSIVGYAYYASLRSCTNNVAGLETIGYIAEWSEIV